MYGHRRESNKKRVSDNGIIQQSPKRNRSASVESVEQQPKSTKIIDLNDDCLIKIFDHLDLSNLFNVAVSNEWLRIAARFVYRRKFGTKIVKIDYVDLYANTHAYRDGMIILTPINDVDQIRISELKTCLQFLRFFGPSIDQLKVDHSRSNSKYSDYIDQYINQYCAECLVSLSFANKSNSLVKSFQKPFVMVENVHIMNVDLGNQLPLFVEWFPNLRRLELRDVRVNRRYIEASFNHTEHLSIEISNRNAEVGFSKQNVTDLLRLNSQLRSLYIYLPGRQGMTLTALMNIARRNPRISTLLVFESYECYTIRVKTAELIQFAGVQSSLVDLGVSHLRFTADEAIVLIRQLIALKTFRFTLENSTEIDNLMRQLDNEWYLINYSVPFTIKNRCIIVLKRKY